MTKSATLVNFTEEILNGKFHFLCSDYPQPISYESQPISLDKDVLKTSCKQVLKTSCKMKNCYAKDVFKTFYKTRNVCWE